MIRFIEIFFSYIFPLFPLLFLFPVLSQIRNDIKRSKILRDERQVIIPIVQIKKGSTD